MNAETKPVDPTVQLASVPIDMQEMVVYAYPSPKNPGNYRFTSSPDSVTFHNKTPGVARALKCSLVTEGGDTPLFFTGYAYVSKSGLAQFASGMTANVITIAFNFDGQEVEGDLTFFIAGGGSATLRMDPQVGNDPTTGGGNNNGNCE